jgi:hypothetical protein
VLDCGALAAPSRIYLTKLSGCAFFQVTTNCTIEPTIIPQLFVLQASFSGVRAMPGKAKKVGAPSTPALEIRLDGNGHAEPDKEVAEAFARVQQTVTDMKNGELLESL